jgi:hypothetical protein
MRFSIFLLMISILSAGLFTNCSKGSGHIDDGSGGGGGGGGGGGYSVGDTIAPVLEITTPVNNQVYSSGSTINITGRIMDNEGLYRGSIRVTNDANGSLLKEQLYEIHFVLSYTFNVAYAANVSAPSDYTITVFFEDHGYNSVTRSVKVKINP